MMNIFLDFNISKKQYFNPVKMMPTMNKDTRKRNIFKLIGRNSFLYERNNDDYKEHDGIKQLAKLIFFTDI